MLNAIVWTKGNENIVSESMKKPYWNKVSWQVAKTHENVSEILSSDIDVHLLITILSPSDIESLYQIKVFQETNPSLSMIAIFDAKDVSAIDQALALILGSHQQKETISHVTNQDSLTLSTNVKHNSHSDFQSREEIDCHLTPRQLEVLELIMVGKSNKEIARDLSVSEGTVKVHCMALFREMCVKNRTQAALMAETIFCVG